MLTYNLIQFINALENYSQQKSFKKMAKDNTFSLKHLFTTAAVALAIDLCLVFPISHSSLIGQAWTAISASVIVPPLDFVATEFFGMGGAKEAAERVLDIVPDGTDYMGSSLDMLSGLQ